MAPVLAATGAGLLVGSAVTIAVLTVWGRVRDARRLEFFRCRLRPAVSRRGRRARWCLRRTRATWVGDVLMVRLGVLRLWLTPLHVGVARHASVQSLRPRDVRGLGSHPVALRFTLRDGGGEMVIAVPVESSDRLIGPFLTTAMAAAPVAPREPGT